MTRYLESLKPEVMKEEAGEPVLGRILRARGLASAFDDSWVMARARGVEAMFSGIPAHVYPYDRILGSLRGLYTDADPAEKAEAETVLRSYGERGFLTNADHFAPDYAAFLKEGVGGTLERIRCSMSAHAGDEKRTMFLEACAVSMQAFGRMVARYADAAEALASSVPEAQAEELRKAAACCRAVSSEAPHTFREALQLVFLAHEAFVYEDRYAMAFGRMDQFLYPFFERDLREGRLDADEATDLLACALIKIADVGRSDVCNIAIGGVTRSGECAVNELSYCILEAVRRCAVPGPNLSARVTKLAPERFLDECLKVIGTGIGYPALMNDEVNVAALRRMGYAEEDCRDYCMVGCIENFLPGLQPPWSDGRYNTPKYLELALNDGICLMTGVRLGPATGTADTLDSMDTFVDRLKQQMEAGAARYMAFFRNENARYDPEQYAQPFLSCFAAQCIERGLDINNGGTVYPSAHGAGCMGIGTVADSLAAMEKVIFTEKKATPDELLAALKANFVGYEPLYAALLEAPKYGNDEDAADQWAVWYLKTHAEIFDHYRTPDGGRVYVAMASNVQNISAGREVAATADGRGRGEPLSDAASPMHGMDVQGPTAVVLSVTKPDYTLAACGTVLNQKYSPSMFTDPARRKQLGDLIRVYFARGGQEMQINSVSRAVLTEAMEKPEAYRSLVVRVSGFSAYYTELERSVQEDILKRTEQG